jgi:hypothetical protein
MSSHCQRESIILGAGENGVKRRRGDAAGAWFLVGSSCIGCKVFHVERFVLPRIYVRKDKYNDSKRNSGKELQDNAAHQVAAARLLAYIAAMPRFSRRQR